MSENKNNKDLLLLLWNECNKAKINTTLFTELMEKWAGQDWYNENPEAKVGSWKKFIKDEIKLENFKGKTAQEIINNEDLKNCLLKYAGYGLQSELRGADLRKKAKDNFEKKAGNELDQEIGFDPSKQTLQNFLLGDCTKVLIGSGGGAVLPGRLKYNVENENDSKIDLKKFEVKTDELINEINLYQSIIKSNSLEEMVLNCDSSNLSNNEGKLKHFVAKIIFLVVFEKGWDLVATTTGLSFFKLLYERLSSLGQLEGEGGFIKTYEDYCAEEKLKGVKDAKDAKDKLCKWISKDAKELNDSELQDNLLKCNYFATKMLRYSLGDKNFSNERFQINDIEDVEDNKKNKLKNFIILKCMERLVYPIVSGRDTFSKIDTEAPIIYTGAPGTGKTYGIENYVKRRCIEKPMQKMENLSDDFTQYKLVQFHSSFDYSDFVDGIRPIPMQGDDSKIRFVRVDGVFKEFCRNVELYNRNGNAANKRDGERKKDKFYFIIDEINRADLGKVFGELMYCFEKDKRGPEHSVPTQYSNLVTYALKKGNYEPIKKEDDVFAKGFFIPENVIIIGSMNDIDRSVETFDFALRRRFTWITLDTNKMVDIVLNDMGINKEERECVISMNNVISGEKGENLGLNKSYCIGPAHFKELINITDEKDDNCEKVKNEIWKNTVCQLLKEYTRGRAREDVEELLLACYHAFMGDNIELPKEEEKVDYRKEIENVANDDEKIKQIVFVGAPGTGKTWGIEHAVKELAGPTEEQAEEQAKKQAKEQTVEDPGKEYYEFVQFHSSYDYTDFVEGLRPIDGKEGPSFIKMDGVFKKFCRKAAKNPDKKYYFIIDEINRADLGKVFGELMYCFEYRGEDKAIQTQYSNLKENEGDVFEKGFFIPNNVVIIGSMNDIDRSVETFDFALRRRFKWFEVKANKANYEEVFKGMNGNQPYPSKDGIIDKIVAMNNIISGTGPDEGAQFGLNDSYWIGPSFFKEYVECSTKSTRSTKKGDEALKNILENIWKNRIEPTIREYVRGRNSNSVDNFILKCHDALIQKKAKE